MSIRQRLYFSILLPVFLATIALSLILSWSSHQVRDAIELGSIVDQVLRGVFELNMLTSDYLLHHEDRAKEQWGLRYASLTELLTKVEVNDSAGQVLLDEIVQTLSEIEPLFSDLVATHVIQESSEDKLGVGNVEQLLAAQITGKTQTMVGVSMQLADLNRVGIEKVQERSNLIIIFVGGSVVIPVMIIIIWTANILIGGIGKLHQGTQIIASGDMDHKVLIDSQDELGDLAQAFNAMTASRKSAETALRNYTTKLEQSNRDLQEFAYVASHDLQEPLRKILAFGDRLASRYTETLDERGQDYLRRMQDASSRMQTLINALLNFSRVQTRTQPFTSLDLDQIAAEVVSDLEFQIEQVDGLVEIDPLPTIEADPSQMRQLLQNLIGNALKFHRPGVPPHIRVYSIEDETTFRVDLISHNRSCQIAIEDNGIGFDPQFAERIFKPFQRLHGHGEYEGSGMGLAICRRIVERHDGQITAHGQPDQGAMFIVTLPVTQKYPDNPDGLGE